MSWLTQDSPSGVHVIPLGDCLAHTESSVCPCAPKVVSVGYTANPCADGHRPRAAVRLLVTHQAMDGRAE